jgi:ribosomal protein S18 acetylase RimI-like enzyme
MTPSMPQIRTFTRTDLGDAIALFAAEGWQTYAADPERTDRALTAPGSTTLVAHNEQNVIGLVQLQSDGEIQAHLSALIVARQWRRHGLGRALLANVLEHAGGVRIDLLSRAGRYYRSLGAEQIPVFRLTRHDLDGEGSADGSARRAD